MKVPGVSESDFLRTYDARAFDRPNFSVDTVVFTVADEQLQVLLVKRDQHPFRGYFSLVGGFVDLEVDQDLQAAALRRLTDKTGVVAPYLEQVQTVGNQQRDPRCWSVTTVYFSLLAKDRVKPVTGTGTSAVEWVNVSEIGSNRSLAFDHGQLVSMAVERLRNKVLYTALPAHLLPEQFSLTQLQRIYELILNRALEAKAFRRRILSAEILVECGSKQQARGRPTQMYRLADPRYTYVFSRPLDL